MSTQELFLSEWHKLIEWFEKVKSKTGVQIVDNFTVNQGEVLINGDTLTSIIEDYIYRNNITAENINNLNWLDIHCCVSRVNLQGYLLNQLYAIKSDN